MAIPQPPSRPQQVEGSLDYRTANPKLGPYYEQVLKSVIANSPLRTAEDLNADRAKIEADFDALLAKDAIPGLNGLHDHYLDALGDVLETPDADAKTLLDRVAELSQEIHTYPQKRDMQGHLRTTFEKFSRDFDAKTSNHLQNWKDFYDSQDYKDELANNGKTPEQITKIQAERKAELDKLHQNQKKMFEDWFFSAIAQQVQVENQVRMEFFEQMRSQAGGRVDFQIQDENHQPIKFKPGLIDYPGSTTSSSIFHDFTTKLEVLDDGVTIRFRLHPFKNSEQQIEYAINAALAAAYAARADAARAKGVPIDTSPIDTIEIKSGSYTFCSKVYEKALKMGLKVNCTSESFTKIQQERFDKRAAKYLANIKAEQTADEARAQPLDKLRSVTLRNSLRELAKTSTTPKVEQPSKAKDYAETAFGMFHATEIALASPFIELGKACVDYWRDRRPANKDRVTLNNFDANAINREIAVLLSDPKNSPREISPGVTDPDQNRQLAEQVRIILTRNGVQNVPNNFGFTDASDKFIDVLRQEMGAVFTPHRGAVVRPPVPAPGIVPGAPGVPPVGAAVGPGAGAAALGIGVGRMRPPPRAPSPSVSEASVSSKSSSSMIHVQGDNESVVSDSPRVSEASESHPPSEAGSEAESKVGSVVSESPAASPPPSPPESPAVSPPPSPRGSRST